MKNTSNFKRIRVKELDIDKGIKLLKSLRNSIIIDWITKYLMALTVYLILQIAIMYITNSYIDRGLIIIGVIITILIVFVCSSKPKMELFLVKDNITILKQFKKCHETNNIILWHILKLHSDSFCTLCEMNGFPGIVPEIIIGEDSEEEEKEDE